MVTRWSSFFAPYSSVATIILSVAGLRAQVPPSVKSALLPLISSARPADGFQQITSETSNVTFSHRITPDRSLTNQMLLDGAGVALADVDEDGRVDLFFGASNGESQLWRNLGNWRFEQRTESAFPNRKVDLAGDVTGVVFADLNGDGKPDLILNSHEAGVRILINQENATFRSLPFRQARSRGGHSVAVADIDGDGWLDLYVCNYRQRALMDTPSARATFKTINGAPTMVTFNGRPATDPDLTNRFIVGPTGELDELGEPDVIYRNIGGTNFLEVNWTTGSLLQEDGQAFKTPPSDWGLAAQFCDINEDGRPDLYVCNDFHTPDRFWLNESKPGNVRFRLVPRATLRHTSLFSMGVDFADVNRDSRWDFIVLDMLSPDHARRLTTLDGSSSVTNDTLDPRSRPQFDANTLFLQRSDSSFIEVANFAGLAATDWSWTPAFMDVDLDGWPDLLVTAGQERGSRDLDVAEHMKAFRRGGLRTDAQIFRERQKFPSQSAPLKAFRNLGSSDSAIVPRWEDASQRWGFDFNGVSHGMAFADLDADGDLDVVVNHLQAPAGLFQNVSTAPRISIRLKGRSPNTAAVGAQLSYWSGPGAKVLPQTAQITAGGRYLSSDDFSKTFACVDSASGRLEIRWPSGQITTHTNLQANNHYEIEESIISGEGSKAAPPNSVPNKRLSFAAKLLDLPLIRRQPIDFSAQPSLPRLQSTRWPSLALAPTDSPGFSLWVGGSDQPVHQIAVAPPQFGVAREIGSLRSAIGIVPWGNELVVATDPWGAKTRTHSKLISLNLKTGAERTIATRVSAISCLATEHEEPKDGALLFLGGGSLLGDYPNGSTSELLRWDGQNFEPLAVTNLGLVTGALFAELDPAPGSDLVTVSEWGAPHIFSPYGRQLAAWDPPVTFGQSTTVRLGELNGCWQSVAAADVDRDGRIDLLLGNWGLNSRYALYTGPASGRDFRGRKLFLYQGKFQESARTCVEAYQSAEDRSLPIQGLSYLSKHLPWISENFRTFRAFAAADLEQILGDRSNQSSRLESHWFSSLILLNRGDHFEAHPLPDLAQLGPIFALQAGDFDEDGFVDFYGAQGFFGYAAGRSREDAGEGVFLLGRGDGSFDAVSTVDAGFRLLGEQRSVLSADLNNDRRTDLVIGEFGGPVTVLINRRP